MKAIYWILGLSAVAISGYLLYRHFFPTVGQQSTRLGQFGQPIRAQNPASTRPGPYTGSLVRGRSRPGFADRTETNAIAEYKRQSITKTPNAVIPPRDGGYVKQPPAGIRTSHTTTEVSYTPTLITSQKILA